MFYDQDRMSLRRAEAGIARLEALFWRLDDRLRLITKMEHKMSQEMDRLRAAVTAERTVSASIVTLLNDINQKLRDAGASGDPAALMALADEIEANTKALADAVVANTPPAPTP